jgi:ketosteroid isomerase-like protein
MVKEALRGFVAQLRLRNVEATVALFREDAVLFGSEEHESAIGIDELRDFLSRLFGRGEVRSMR